ncbi:MAG: universal stress protein [Alphaproteobacteria bacterium]|nr:universal stress protein [Alphaproteobacteria bacterium]
MAIKDLLVHVSTEADAKPVVDAALTLAAANDAHVIGIGIRPPLDVPSYAAARLPDSVVELLEKREDDRLQAAREMFEARAKRAGREDRCEWRSDIGIVEETLGLHARYADLTVVPQPNPEAMDKRFTNLAEDMLMTAGRPVLIVPYIGAPETIGKRAIVAWNASREAARAVADAMPLLEQAEKVEVFAGGDQGIGDLPGADIATHLARHAIDVTVFRNVTDELSVSETLFNRVANMQADLIVMGGYGRSRFREFVLGGVTRDVLQHMTVPVLMSH